MVPVVGMHVAQSVGGMHVVTVGRTRVVTAGGTPGRTAHAWAVLLGRALRSRTRPHGIVGGSVVNPPEKNIAQLRAIPALPRYRNFEKGQSHLCIIKCLLSDVSSMSMLSMLATKTLTSVCLNLLNCSTSSMLNA